MNDTQEKVYDLLKDYFEHCRKIGYTRFRMWCEDNIDTINEEALVEDICSEVEHIALNLFD